MNTTPPAFLGAFTLARRFGSLNPRVIEDRIRETIREDPEVMWTMHEIILNDANLQGRWHRQEPDLVLDHVINSVYVDILPYQTRGGVAEPLVRVYMESPTACADDWAVFRDRVMGLAFGDDLTGNPALFTGSLWCAICHGHDHPMGLCPLLTVPGWHGPTLTYPTLRIGLRRPDRAGKKETRIGTSHRDFDKGAGPRKRRDRDDDYAGGAASGLAGASGSGRVRNGLR